MKTSNKLIIGTGICIILGIFSYAFVMRGAYQKALANPLANELRIDFKAMKYLNLNYVSYVTFKHGNKHEIVMNKSDKDSLQIDYQGDIINLKVGDIHNVTIYCPQIPIVSFAKKDKLNYRDDTPIYIDGTFQSGDFVATSLINTNVEFIKCRFDKVDIQSKEKAEISMEESEIKLLNLILPKNSRLNINYSKILAKNIILGDSCSISIVGNQSVFLK
ncbi:MAG: hypothetical protein H7339_15245 [Arcicella sp.]|nr:hypothetical protein [Arcicella sp.]